MISLESDWNLTSQWHPQQSINTNTNILSYIKRKISTILANRQNLERNKLVIQLIIIKHMNSSSHSEKISNIAL